MIEYLIVEYPDGAQYAVPADRAHMHAGAKVVGKEHPTGVVQSLEEPAAPTAAVAEESAAPAPETPTP